ncbi:MAG: KOW domain-containing RNA-binding protein [Oscillospiraceae bacterium]|nr:KOW domain-containing RNA-binding protein [Oscillospiraceae bacterium]
MNPVTVSGIVMSLAGHDKGRLYALLKTDGRFAYLSDGKIRKVDNPKRKNIKHIKKLNLPAASEDTGQKETGDREIRKMLAAARKTETTEEGSTAWQKMM